MKEDDNLGDLNLSERMILKFVWMCYWLQPHQYRVHWQAVMKQPRICGAL